MQQGPAVLNRRSKRCSKASKFFRSIFNSPTQAAVKCDPPGPGCSGTSGQAPVVTSPKKQPSRCTLQRPTTWGKQPPPCCSGQCHQQRYHQLPHLQPSCSGTGGQAAAATSAKQQAPRCPHQLCHQQPTNCQPATPKPQPARHQLQTQELVLVLKLEPANQQLAPVDQPSRQQQQQQQQQQPLQHRPLLHQASTPIASTPSASLPVQAEPIDLSMTKRLPVGQRPRTSLRELITDCKAVARAASVRRQKDFKVAPAPKTLWLHQEAASPLPLQPPTITTTAVISIAAMAPSSLTANSRRMNGGAGELPALIFLKPTPPPQLAKLRPPPVLTLAPAPLGLSSFQQTPSPKRGSSPQPAVETPTTPNRIIGRVADAVRRFNAAQQASGQPSLPISLRHADQTKASDTWAVAAPPAVPPSTPSSAAKSASDDQRPRPSFSELLETFEAFDRRRRERAAATAAASAETSEATAEVLTSKPQPQPEPMGQTLGGHRGAAFDDVTEDDTASADVGEDDVTELPVPSSGSAQSAALAMVVSILGLGILLLAVGLAADQ